MVLRGNNNKQVSTRERTLGKRPLASSARYFIHIRERARLSVYMKVCKLRTKNINDSFGKENRHSESSSEIDWRQCWALITVESWITRTNLCETMWATSSREALVGSWVSSNSQLNLRSTPTDSLSTWPTKIAQCEQKSFASPPSLRMFNFTTYKICVKDRKIQITWRCEPFSGSVYFQIECAAEAEHVRREFSLDSLFRASGFSAGKTQ